MSETSNVVSPSPAAPASVAGPVVSLKLLSSQCGVYSRRVLVPASATHEEVLAALELPSGTVLLYREHAHRCSELVRLANDRFVLLQVFATLTKQTSDWRAAVHRSSVHNHADIAVLTEASHKERKQRYKKLACVAVAVVIGAVLVAVLKHLGLFSCGGRGALWPVLLVVALFGFIGAAVGRKNCHNKGSNRCRPNRNVNAPPQPHNAPVSPAPAEPPVSAVNFREQLQTLFTLGFTDVRKSVEELQRAGGDLNVAVQALLNDSK